MRSPSQIVHALRGAPVATGCVNIPACRCWVCGATAVRGVRVDAWGGAESVGGTRVRAPESQHLCEACVAVLARFSPCPPRAARSDAKRCEKAEKAKLDHCGDEACKTCGKGYQAPRWNNFSVLWQDGDRDVTIATKGEKPLILAWLRTPRIGTWFAAIAETGQKNILPWAPLNLGPTGTIKFDDQMIEMPSTEAWSVVDEMTDLLTRGVTKDELISGDYTPRAYTLCARQIMAFEETWRYRRGGWFQLASWLAQRDEEKVAARMAAEKEASRERKRKPAGASSEGTKNKAEVRAASNGGSEAGDAEGAGKPTEKAARAPRSAARPARRSRDPGTVGVPVGTGKDTDDGSLGRPTELPTPSGAGSADGRGDAHEVPPSTPTRGGAGEQLGLFDRLGG